MSGINGQTGIMPPQRRTARRKRVQQAENTARENVLQAVVCPAPGCDAVLGEAAKMTGALRVRCRNAACGRRSWIVGDDRAGKSHVRAVLFDRAPATVVR
jgi:hypothetical protein